MTGQKKFLSNIIRNLDVANIPYMICGSLSSSLYGEPRATMDIDIIIKCGIKQIQKFIHEFPENDYYADLDSAEEALRTKSMFNIIDLNSGWKADFIFLKDSEFAHEEFARRKSAKLLGIDLKILSEEDTILSKLEWAKIGESERQFRDALGVAIAKWEVIDFKYLKSWARKIDVETLLDKLLEEAKKLQ